jgi:hypothetical protein
MVIQATTRTAMEAIDSRQTILELRNKQAGTTDARKESTCVKGNGFFVVTKIFRGPNQTKKALRRNRLEKSSLSQNRLSLTCGRPPNRAVLHSCHLENLSAGNEQLFTQKTHHTF